MSIARSPLECKPASLKRRVMSAIFWRNVYGLRGQTMSQPTSPPLLFRFFRARRAQSGWSRVKNYLMWARSARASPVPRWALSRRGGPSLRRRRLRRESRRADERDLTGGDRIGNNNVCGVAGPGRGGGTHAAASRTCVVAQASRCFCVVSACGVHVFNPGVAAEARRLPSRANVQAEQQKCQPPVLARCGWHGGRCCSALFPWRLRAS